MLGIIPFMFDCWSNQFPSSYRKLQFEFSLETVSSNQRSSFQSSSRHFKARLSRTKFTWSARIKLLELD